jgi:hypothetical protein
MACCGQGSVQALAMAAVLIDEGAAALVLTKLVYIGSDRRTQPFVVEGKVYQFGNNARRRVNAVSARVTPTFLQGRWAGQFVVYDPMLHNEDGTPLIVPPDPGGKTAPPKKAKGGPA